MKLPAPIGFVVRKVAPHGVREALLLAAARVLRVGHGTNKSGNNLSQR
jgi:hypothetical protein